MRRRCFIKLSATSLVAPWFSGKNNPLRGPKLQTGVIFYDSKRNLIINLGNLEKGEEIILPENWNSIYG